jgi:MFS family permease
VSGLGGGAAGPASSALIADVVGAEDRMRAYGLRHWAVNIGFSVAPIAGGLLARRTYAGLFLADGATTLLAVALIAARVPAAPPPPAGPPAASSTTAALHDRTFLAFLGCTLLVAVVYTQVESSMPIDMIGKGISTETYGLVVALNGALVMLLTPAVTGALAKADPPRVVAGAAVLTAIGFGLNAVVATAPLYAVAVAIWTLGEITSTPATAAVVMGMAPRDQRGRYSGASAMTWKLARFVGPPAGGIVLAHVGSAALWIGCAGVAMMAAMAALSIAGRVRGRLAREAGESSAA